MYYLQIYEDIVNNALDENRKKLKRDDKDYIYYENHHILPKCLDGENKKENLVLLTGKEHYLSHKLLVEIFPDEDKLIYSLWVMCNANKTGDRKYKTGAREYERLKIKFSKNQTGDKNHRYGKKPWNTGLPKELQGFYGHQGCMRGKKHSKETREKISEAGKGKIHSKKTIEKIRQANLGEKNPMYGKIVSKETKRKISKANKGKNNPMYGKSGKLAPCFGRVGDKHPMFGKHHSKESIEKIKQSQQKRPILKCKYCNFETKNVGNMKQWHNENCKLKS